MSNSKTSTSDGLRVLVCGSGQFYDHRFVFGMLDGFRGTFDISAILSGPFSGPDQFAREWCSEHSIAYERVNIAGGERLELAYFDESRELPDSVLERDPMFRRGFEKLRDSAATVVLLIPRPDGQLGPTCSCLKRMAKMVNIPCIDGSEAIKNTATRMVSASAKLSAEAATSLPAPSSRAAGPGR